MKTKQQALTSFHNAVGDAITENLCDGNINRKDIMEADLWTLKEIADSVERMLIVVAIDDAEDAGQSTQDAERRAKAKFNK